MAAKTIKYVHMSPIAAAPLISQRPANDQEINAFYAKVYANASFLARFHMHFAYVAW